MTREEAISFLKKGTRFEPTLENKDYPEAFDMAIKALEQEPCEDAISRQAVFEQIAGWIISGEYGFTNATDYLSKKIKALPPVTPQPKIGRWIKNEWGNIFCSSCGCAALYDKVYPGESVFGKAIRVKSTFCPTCGAKMQEVEE